MKESAEGASHWRGGHCARRQRGAPSRCLWGVYGQIIGAVSHLFQRPGESVRILLPYARLGMAAGIGGLAFVIETLFGTFPFAASMAFLGLILGGIPSLLRKAEFSRSGLKKYVLAVAVFCLMTVIAIGEGGKGGGGELAFSTAAERLATMTCVGMIASITMVVPGVSGTMLLMMMGYYQPVLHAFNLVQAGFLTGDWQTVLEQQELLLPFTFGLAAGIFLCARTMEAMLARWETFVYAAVTGLVLSSPGGDPVGNPHGGCGRRAAGGGPHAPGGGGTSGGEIWGMNKNAGIWATFS